MPDHTPNLRPATPDEIAETLAFALLYEGRKRVHQADDVMARIAADRLVRHLERLGCVAMKAHPVAAHFSYAPTGSEVISARSASRPSQAGQRARDPDYV